MTETSWREFPRSSWNSPAPRRRSTAMDAAISRNCCCAARSEAASSAARRLINLFDFGHARSVQPFGFRGPIPPRLFAHFRHLLIEPRDLRFDRVQLAVGFRLGGRGFLDARRNGLRVAAEERPAVLRDQVGDAAKNDQES